MFEIRTETYTFDLFRNLEPLILIYVAIPCVMGACCVSPKYRKLSIKNIIKRVQGCSHIDGRVFKSQWPCEFFLLTNCLRRARHSARIMRNTLPAMQSSKFVHASVKIVQYFLAWLRALGLWEPYASSYWMHGERKFVHFYLFESFSRPFYKTIWRTGSDFVDQWDWMHSFNFGNSLKPTRCARGV